MAGPIDGGEAWNSTAAQPSRRWKKGLDRFSENPVRIDHRPKFALDVEQKVFCVGSCFARNIEEHLIYGGARLLSRRIVSPRREYKARPNGFVNKFTIPSILNEIDWVLSPPENQSGLFCRGAGGYLDLQLAPGMPPVSLERAKERRAYLLADYFPRILEADVVILTLGLDEVWLDRETGLHLNAPPPLSATATGRYAVAILGYAESLEALETIRSLLLARRPGMKFIVTVSPVPLDVTFFGPDPALSTMRAKSMLRTVAQTFSDRHADADYFPSYEMITLSPRAVAFAPDCRHVADEAVGTVMRRFMKLYMGHEAEPPDGFVELSYLSANPKVEEAVRAGLYESGYDHWLQHGRGEHRRLAPFFSSSRMRHLGLR